VAKKLHIIGAWRSLAARLLWEQEVGGSNPLAPTSLRFKTKLDKRKQKQSPHIKIQTLENQNSHCLQ
jgi:hypothetical protein